MLEVKCKHLKPMLEGICSMLGVDKNMKYDVVWAMVENNHRVYLAYHTKLSSRYMVFTYLSDLETWYNSVPEQQEYKLVEIIDMRKDDSCWFAKDVSWLLY